MSALSSFSQPSVSYTGNSAPTDYWIDSDGTAHESCRLLVFIGADFLGESSIDPGNCPELGYRRGGVAYFCPHCGEIWGRLVLVDSKGQSYFAELVRISCEQHYDQWEIPGSLLGGYLNEFYLKYLPEQALRRELLIHLRQMEKES